MEGQSLGQWSSSQNQQRAVMQKEDKVGFSPVSGAASLRKEFGAGQECFPEGAEDEEVGGWAGAEVIGLLTEEELELIWTIMWSNFAM
jgi:hypothetical protein